MNFKKALSLAMATAMVAGVASVASFAATINTVVPSLTEDKWGLDSGYNGGLTDGDGNWNIGNTGKDTIASDKTIYKIVNDAFGDGDNFKFSYKKGDNAKIIKKISLVEKNFGAISGNQRAWAVKIELVEDMTDKEYKMNPTITFTAKKAFTNTNSPLQLGDPLVRVPMAIGDKFNYDFAFWVQNGEISGTDQENVAGTTGAYAKPVKNEDNEVVWVDVNRDLAKLTFVGDSDVSTYYPKLSTKWGNDVYAANFADGEAFKFEFVGNANISATARPTLTIYNPFINDDEEYSVDVADLTVYQLIDDEFVDVTDKFTAGTDDDGNQVLTTKTRTLGFYVVCDEAAAASGVITDEPVDGKEIPSTGR